MKSLHPIFGFILAPFQGEEPCSSGIASVASLDSSSAASSPELSTETSDVLDPDMYEIVVPTDEEMETMYQWFQRNVS